MWIFKAALSGGAEQMTKFAFNFLPSAICFPLCEEDLS